LGKWVSAKTVYIMIKGFFSSFFKDKHGFVLKYVVCHRK
jgi:hypothetical protein